MATVPETQALLDELEIPTICAKASLKATMKPFQEKANEMCQQLARTRMLLGLSEMEEPADTISAKFEHFDDQLRTGDRLMTEIHGKIREAGNHFKRMAQTEGEIQVLAGVEGYTVP
jgi:hypothetical protein